MRSQRSILAGLLLVSLAIAAQGCGTPGAERASGYQPTSATGVSYLSESRGASGSEANHRAPGISPTLAAQVSDLQTDIGLGTLDAGLQTASADTSSIFPSTQDTLFASLGDIGEEQNVFAECGESDPGSDFSDLGDSSSKYEFSDFDDFEAEIMSDPFEDDPSVGVC